MRQFRDSSCKASQQLVKSMSAADSTNNAGADSRQLRGIAHEEGAPNNKCKRLGMRSHFFLSNFTLTPKKNRLFRCPPTIFFLAAAPPPPPPSPPERDTPPSLLHPKIANIDSQAYHNTMSNTAQIYPLSYLFDLFVSPFASMRLAPSLLLLLPYIYIYMCMYMYIHI